MGELGALFNPGMRHELEERRSKAMRREEEGNARDGDLRIDLESGVAVINVPGVDGGTAEQSPAVSEQSGVAEQHAVAEHGAPADQDAVADQDTRAEDRSGRAATGPSTTGPSTTGPSTTDPSTTDPSTTAEIPAAAADAAPPAQPRPRGKRGLAASSR